MNWSKVKSCMYYEKAESEAQRGKPKGTLESEMPTRLARIRPGPTDIRHVMIRGWVSGGQGCYCLMRGSTGSPPYTVHELP